MSAIRSTPTVSIVSLMGSPFSVYMCGTKLLEHFSDWISGIFEREVGSVTGLEEGVTLRLSLDRGTYLTVPNWWGSSRAPKRFWNVICRIREYIYSDDLEWTQNCLCSGIFGNERRKSSTTRVFHYTSQALAKLNCRMCGKRDEYVHKVCHRRQIFWDALQWGRNGPWA